MGRGRPVDPHAIEKGDHRRGASADLTEKLALPVLDRLRAADAAGVQMLHKRKKKRQVLCRDSLLIEGEDERAALGVDEKIRVLDAFGNALIGQQLPHIIGGEESGKLLRRYLRIDRHLKKVPARWNRRRRQTRPAPSPLAGEGLGGR